jgi:hypothetical protein
MQNQSRSHSVTLAVSVLLLGCGLLLVGLLNLDEHSPYTVVRQQEPVTPAPRQQTSVTNVFDYSALQDLKIQTGIVTPPKPNAWQTAAVFLADSGDCQVFIDANPPVPLQELCEDHSAKMWSTTVPLGDFEKHDVKVLNGNGRLLRGASVVAVVEGEPTPIFEYVSQ